MSLNALQNNLPKFIIKIVKQIVIMSKTEEEFQVGLELALGEILRTDKINVWIACADRPISKILAEAGIDVKYTSFVLRGLERVGLVEAEGEKAGKRYKIKSQVIPDIKFLIKSIREEMREKQRGYQEAYLEKQKQEGYPESAASDLKPSKVKKEKTEDLSTVPVKIKRPVNIPNLGEMRFMVISGFIVEVKITAIYFNEEDKVRYKVEHFDFNVPQSTEKSMMSVLDVNLKNLFSKPQEAADYLLRNLVKYVKK